MNFEFYWRLRHSLHYDIQKDQAERQILLSILPNKLKVELSNLMFTQ